MPCVVYSVFVEAVRFEFQSLTQVKNNEAEPYLLDSEPDTGSQNTLRVWRLGSCIQGENMVQGYTCANEVLLSNVAFAV